MIVMMALVAGLAPEKPVNARASAHQVYVFIKEHPFEVANNRSVLDQFDRARRIAPNDPYVLLASAMLVKLSGYKSGDMTHSHSYQPESLAAATTLTERAIAADGSAFDAHVERGWLYILDGMLRNAQAEFLIANKAQPTEFEPWYGAAVCLWYQGDITRSNAVLREAAKRARSVYQRRQLLRQDERAARARGDVAGVEKALRQHIALSPDYAWAHGNYGAFLLDQGRYDEAVAALERAVSINPYPLAVDQLATARRLRAGSRLPK
jgi:Tfp pilus assembly protein PilF